MPRRERPLEPGEGALLRFAADLRALRRDSGNPTYRELARRAYYSAGTLSDAAAGRKLPSLAVTLGYVRACGGDVDAWERRWHSLAAEEAPPLPEDCPYVGLMPYQVTDADRFFGRDRLVGDVCDGLATQRFVTVFGASGAGKSSLLRAGVLPRLGQRALVFTPGAHPLEECAVHLAALTGMTAGQLLLDLQADPGNLHRTIRQTLVRAPDDAEVVLVLDQFEEVFTRCTDGERASFLDALLHATEASNSRTRIVAAVRSDFYPRCAEHAGLATAVSRTQVLVGPMTANELRDAIIRPAIEAGCTVEGALVAELVADAHRQTGMLPLLSHVLRETWARRRGNTVTLAGYQATGGLHEALARTAETLFATLDPGQRADARTLFVHLTALGEDGSDTKRRAGWSEVDVDDTVLATFTDARLITVDDSGVEMTHEALIRAWPRLSGWLTNDRDRLHTQRQLAEDAATWESLGRDPDALYRGGRLAVAQELPPGDLTSRERAFVEASTDVERTRRHTARRRIRQLRWLSAGLAVALVSTVVFAGLMARSQRQTEEQRRIAVSRQLAAQADAAARTNAGEAIRMSLDALDAAPTTEARSSVLNLIGNPVSHGAIPDSVVVALSANGQMLAELGLHGIGIWNVPRRERIRTIDQAGPPIIKLAISPTGDRLATGDLDRRLRVRSLVSDDTPIWRNFDADIRALAFSPDGHRLAVLDDLHTLTILDARTLRGVASVPGGTHSPSGEPFVVFSPDSSTIAAPVDTSAIVVRDTSTGQAVARLTDVQGDAPFAISPSGHTIAAMNQKGALVAHDLTTHVVTTLVPAPGQVHSLTYLPDGDLVFASMDHGIQSWTPERAQPLQISTVTPWELHAAGTTIVAVDSTGALIWSIDKLPHYASGVPVALAFDTASGSVLANTYDSAQLERLDRPDPDTLIPPRELNSVTDVTFSSDYRFLALPRPPQEITIYDAATGNRRATLNDLNGSVNDLSFAENNHYLAASYTSREDPGHVVTWDLEKYRVVANLPIHAAEIALSPDGRHLAAATGDDAETTLWDKTKVAELRSDAGRVTALSYQPDGRTLAIGHENGTIELWDTTSRQRVADLRGHTAALSDIRFSPDGTIVATVDEESTILLWDVTSRDQLARIDNLPADITSIAWRPDSHALATALSSGTILIWPTDIDETVTLLCQTLLTDFANYAAQQPPPICMSR